MGRKKGTAECVEKWNCVTYVCSEVKIKRKPQSAQRKKSAEVAEKKTKRGLYHRQIYHAKVLSF